MSITFCVPIKVYVFIIWLVLLIVPNEHMHTGEPTYVFSTLKTGWTGKF